ncbi:MAG: TonB family protein [Terracidiphilus sp.]|nr:TonB family protein [Terracidiphilus sp.]
MPAAVREDESASTGSTARSVALIGPNDANRRVVAHALASSGIATVREFVSYPASLSEVPHISEQRFDMLIIDVDCDESFALAIVEKVVASGKTVVMAYSQRNQPDLIKRCMQAGARDFLPLPADSDPPASDPEPASPPKAEAPPIPQRRLTDSPASPRQQAAVSRPAPPSPVDRPPLPPRDVLDAHPPAESVSPVVPPAPPVAVSLPKSAPPLGVSPRKNLKTEPEPPELEPPIFRYVGMEPPPEEHHHRLPKWVYFVVPLGVLVGIGIAFLPQLRQSLPVGVPLPWNAASNSYGPYKAPAPSGSSASPASAASPSQLPSVQVPARVGKTSAPAVAAPAMDAQLNAPSRISGDLKRPVQKDEPASSFAPVGLDSGASAVPGSAFSSQHNVRPAPPAAISAGVAAGMLIHRTEPVYPEFARKNHLGGTVVLGATIAKNGTLQNIHVISGPPLLREPALTAVRSWRYRPYLLNNQPVEIQTTINIVFKADS